MGPHLLEDDSKHTPEDHVAEPKLSEPPAGHPLIAFLICSLVFDLSSRKRLDIRTATREIAWSRSKPDVVTHAETVFGPDFPVSSTVTILDGPTTHPRPGHPVDSTFSPCTTRPVRQVDVVLRREHGFRTRAAVGAKQLPSTVHQSRYHHLAKQHPKRLPLPPRRFQNSK
mmetsp:Transcript_39998/g.59328  ORF Transcript_39998/g.59328 Transcript_39998/m.59328 type:complete len:170 (-) Transcript_39998:783-1292(-)